jgi:hypothetical protein
LRVCKLCKLNEIGDECHYLFNCEHFQKDRSIYIRNNYLHGSTEHNMRNLFSSQNTQELTNLAKFVYIIMDTCKSSTS